MKLLITFLISICSVGLLAQGPNTTSISVPIDGAHNVNALLTLPDDYSTATSTFYPFILFLHGLGEGGTDLSILYNSSGAGGPCYFVAHGQWPLSTVNPADGKAYKFIILTPQAASGQGIGGSQIDPIVNYMIAHYRIDMTRFYLTGLSEGGQGVYLYVSNCCGFSGQYNPAAVVPMSQAGGKPDQGGCNTTISKNVRAWGFGSESDALGQNTHLWISGNYGGNSCNCTGIGALGRFTAYTGGHCCWNTFYVPTYTESIGGTTMNMYQWMLQFNTSGSTTNTPPVVSAGPDQNLTLPQDTTTLIATASDADGTIAGYQWVQTAGTTATIVSPTSFNTLIRGMGTTGIRTFQVTATDNLGAHTADQVNVTIFPQSTGSSKTINVNLYGSASYINSAWNNWQVTSSLNSGTLLYDDGTPSTISSVLSQEDGYADNGASYAVTMCPQQVGRDASYSTTTRNDTLKGLDNSKLYDISLYSSRGNAGQTTRFTINGVNVDIATNNNFTTIASFPNTAPNSSMIIITITALTSYNYLNGFSLIEHGSSNTTPTTNQPPVARAGADQVVTMPNTTASISGSGSTDDHNIVSYAWSIISGTGGSITSPSSVNTTVTGLSLGTYKIKLTVTDDSAATGSDTMQISVIPAPPITPDSAAKNILKVATGEYATTFMVREKDNSIKAYATVWNGSTNVFGVYTIKGVVDMDGGQYYNIVMDSLGQVYIVGKGSDGTALSTQVLTDTTGAPFIGISKVRGWDQCWIAIKSGNVWYWGKNSLSDALQLNNGSGVFDIVQPIQLVTPAGRSVIDVTTFDNQGNNTPVLLELCSDGTVWALVPGSATPSQVGGLTGITMIGAIARACYFAVSNTDIKAWGPFASYVGLTDNLTTPTSILSQFTSIGLVMPLQQICTNWNCIHFVDANHHLFARGDNVQGEIGNGIQYPTWATYTFAGNPSPFAWSFNKGELMQSPIQIPGTFYNVCSSMCLAFYFWAQDCAGQWYSWGRNKEYALGNGLRQNNDGTYNCWGNIPAPTLVSPSTVIWVKPEPNFNPTATLYPTANAGIGQCISSSIVSLSAAGSAQQSGTIANYLWTKVSGAGGTINSPTSMNTTVSGLSSGLYVFQVTVTNNSGLASSNNVYIEVSQVSSPIKYLRRKLYYRHKYGLH